MLKINPTKTDSQASISINGETVKSVSCARYLGDHFNIKGDNQKLCAERCSRAKGTIIELMAICREVDQFLTLALDAWILSKFSTLHWICLLLVFLILVGVELPLYL